MIWAHWKRKKTQLVNRNETFYNRALSSLVSPYVHNVVSTVVDSHKKKLLVWIHDVKPHAACRTISVIRPHFHNWDLTDCSYHLSKFPTLYNCRFWMNWSVVLNSIYILWYYISILFLFIWFLLMKMAAFIKKFKILYTCSYYLNFDVPLIHFELGKKNGTFWIPPVYITC